MPSRRQHMTKQSLWIACLAAVACSIATSALRADDSIQLLGVAELPGTSLDKSGLPNRLEDGTPHNQLGGLSALDYSGADDIFYVVADRGPKDGIVRFHCRWQAIELNCRTTNAARRPRASSARRSSPRRMANR